MRRPARWRRLRTRATEATTTTTTTRRGRDNSTQTYTHTLLPLLLAATETHGKSRDIHDDTDTLLNSTRRTTRRRTTTTLKATSSFGSTRLNDCAMTAPHTHAAHLAQPGCCWCWGRARSAYSVAAGKTIDCAAIISEHTKIKIIIYLSEIATVYFKIPVIA